MCITISVVFSIFEQWRRRYIVGMVYDGSWKEMLIQLQVPRPSYSTALDVFIKVWERHYSKLQTCPTSAPISCILSIRRYYLVAACHA